jgi:hypothetical protein
MPDQQTSEQSRELKPWDELDADGLDRVEALVADASAVEGICNAHEGAGYYAERIIKRAIEQGTLHLASPTPDLSNVEELVAREIARFFDLDPDDGRCPPWPRELAHKLLDTITVLLESRKHG